MEKLKKINWKNEKSNRNGKLIGNVNLTRQKLEAIKKEHSYSFLNTYSHSGAIIALKNDYYAIGVSNINQAGRGFILTETELLELCKKLDLTITKIK